MSCNFENSHGLCYRKVLRKCGMHMYPKHYVETLLHRALFKVPEVPLIAWTEEQIADYRLDKNNKRGNVYLPLRGDDYEPAEKKQKLNDENDSTVLKLVLSKDEESDTFKSTIINGKENSNKNAKKNYKNNVMDYTTNTSETTDEHMNLSNEPVKIFKSTDSSQFGKITINMSTLIKPHAFQFYCNNWIAKTHKKNEIKSTNIITESPASRPIITIKQLQLSEIESLYQKYFSKSVQNIIVIIANILNIISINNEHYEKRMESIKKKSEAEKRKERFDANRMWLRHKTVLETKLKNYFLKVTMQFAIPEFEPAFKMFFLSILTVLRVLCHTKLRKGNIFKYFVLLLWNSLYSSKLDHVKVFLMLKSKTFRPDCIDLITLIEDSLDSDPSITDRMSLFFVSSVNSQEYFQAVINTVTSDSNEDLTLLIDNAVVQCTINSQFKSSTDLYFSSAVKKVINLKAPASATQSSLKSDESILRRVHTKTLNGTFQPISVNDAKSKTKSPTALENGKPSQQLNSFCNSIARASTSNDVSKILVPKEYFTCSPSVTNGSLQTGPICVTFKPALQAIKPATIPIPVGSTIYLGNKQYTVIRPPVNQLREVTSTQNTILMNPVSTVRKPVKKNCVKCFAKNCQSAVTIMCSRCRSVKYCSFNCQKLDWHETHMHNCGQLNDIRMSHEAQATNVSIN